jgi:hypothetical protein
MARLKYAMTDGGEYCLNPRELNRNRIGSCLVDGLIAERPWNHHALQSLSFHSDILTPSKLNGELLGGGMQ